MKSTASSQWSIHAHVLMINLKLSRICTVLSQPVSIESVGKSIYTGLAPTDLCGEQVLRWACVVMLHPERLPHVHQSAECMLVVFWTA